MFLHILLYRKLADKVGGAGFLVVAPDFLYGDPADRSNPQFDRDAWIKAHDTVSFLLHWFNLRTRCWNTKMRVG